MSDVVERLLKDSDSHYEVARSADMRPEDTLNWAHGQNCQEAADTITRLTAEVAEYEAAFDAQWNADMAGVQMWREAHPGNDMVLPDRANFTSWILAEIVIQRAENKKLRAALRECEAELNAYYRMEYPSDHPYSQKKLAQAMASNPATVALSGDKQ
jgi:hypothetical protein